MDDAAFPKSVTASIQDGMSVSDYFLIRVAQSLVDKFPHSDATAIAERAKEITDALMRKRK